MDVSKYYKPDDCKVYIILCTNLDYSKYNIIPGCHILTDDDYRFVVIILCTFIVPTTTECVILNKWRCHCVYEGLICSRQCHVVVSNIIAATLLKNNMYGPYKYNKFE